MATDSSSTKPDTEDKQDQGAATAGAGEEETAGAADATREGAGADGVAEHTADGEAEDGEEEGAVVDGPDADGAVPARRGSGAAAGAGAVVSAALGLVSLTGTSLTDMFRERESLIGQIKSSSGAVDQIQALYGDPWHTAAMVNGLFAVIAVIVAIVVVAATGRPAGPGHGARAWARPVALGGLVLGVIGFLVAGGMVFDLFASAPQLPAGAGAGGGS